jgi:tetratricopeptide (TPR) repeat protein
MIWLARNLPHDFRTWDRLTQAAFALGLVLLCAAAAAFFLGPADIRVPVLVGGGALILVLEVTVLLGNRGMRSAYALAQQHYLTGDFESARALLERVRASGRASGRVLTLLGNTYRQLGDLEKSEVVLSEALNKEPDHHFPLYGFGRTLLAQGQFSEAAVMIRRALDAGAPPVVLADLGEALCHAGDRDAAARTLRTALEQRETRGTPHRLLMAAWLLYELGDELMLTRAHFEDGLPYWYASAERFVHTPYGVRLKQITERMAQHV